jgi:alpha-L-fucosidase
VKYSAGDIRFTKKDNTLYAFCLGQPASSVRILSLGKNSKLNDKAVVSVKMLGSDEKLIWKQEANGLVINKPSKLPEWQVIVFKINFEQ